MSSQLCVGGLESALRWRRDEEEKEKEERKREWEKGSRKVDAQVNDQLGSGPCTVQVVQLYTGLVCTHWPSFVHVIAPRKRKKGQRPLLIARSPWLGTALPSIMQTTAAAALHFHTHLVPCSKLLLINLFLHEVFFKGLHITVVVHIPVVGCALHICVVEYRSI